MKIGFTGPAILACVWLLFPAPSFAQNACDSVLQLTGREKTIFWSKEQLQRYHNYRESKQEKTELGATVPVDGIPVQGNGSHDASSSLSNEQRLSYEKEFFLFADRVFEPAVNAWKTCMNAKKKSLNLHIRQISDSSILLDLTIDTGLSSTIKAVSYEKGQVSCRVNNKAIDDEEVWKITGESAWSLECKRAGSFNGPVDISIFSGGETFPLTIPERAGPATSLSNGFSTSNFQTCNGSLPIMAANHSREIIQDAPFILIHELRGNAANAIATIRFNGESWGGGNIPVPSGNNSGGGKLPTPSPWVLPAFTPAIITVQGAGTSGACAYVKGAIRISQ